MRRTHYIFSIAVATVLAMAELASAQTQQQINWCEGNGNPTIDGQIAGCTAIIQSKNSQGRTLAVAFRARGNAYDKKGDAERAIADLTQAIRHMPKGDALVPMLYNDRGNYYEQKGEYGKAIADYNETIRIHPSLGWAFGNRARTFLKAGNNAQALSDYERAVVLLRNNDSAYPFTLYGRGIAKLRSGDVHGGEADIAAATALEADIGAAAAKYGLRR